MDSSTALETTQTTQPIASLFLKTYSVNSNRILALLSENKFSNQLFTFCLTTHSASDFRLFSMTLINKGSLNHTNYKTFSLRNHKMPEWPLFICLHMDFIGGIWYLCVSLLSWSYQKCFIRSVGTVSFRYYTYDLRSGEPLCQTTVPKEKPRCHFCWWVSTELKIKHLKIWGVTIKLPDKWPTTQDQTAQKRDTWRPLSLFRPSSWLQTPLPGCELFQFLTFHLQHIRKMLGFKKATPYCEIFWKPENP